MRERNEPVVVSIGIAVSAAGHGVAYAGLGSGEPALRIPFACRAQPALTGRDVAYAALLAVANALLARGYADVEFRTPDCSVPVDLAERRSLPSALNMPYVKLRCTLNRFANATVSAASDRLVRDLTARASADAVLDVAA